MYENIILPESKHNMNKYKIKRNHNQIISFFFINILPIYFIDRWGLSYRMITSERPYVCVMISTINEYNMYINPSKKHVPGTRFELVTRGFSVLCSTS